jgi:hypothetical protein
VIGNRPLTEEDRRHPNGPLGLTGRNLQLEAANYYYGMGPSTIFNMDAHVVQKQSGG